MADGMSADRIEKQTVLKASLDRLPGSEVTTLVEFTLTEVEGGVRLDIVESGFDALPEDVRTSLFDGNSEGWSIQTELVAKYLDLVDRR
ncbi:hypothetical protein BH09ACT7_BH09ACT7_46570 [soil metagenome]